MTIKRTWVKAHQDEKKIPGQVLSDAALRDIKVDSMAVRLIFDCLPSGTSIIYQFSVYHFGRAPS
jgi:hypothetical protein